MQIRQQTIKLLFYKITTKEVLMDIVSKFLKEYEQKRINSELDLEKGSKNYIPCRPRLSEIEKN